MLTSFVKDKSERDRRRTALIDGRVLPECIKLIMTLVVKNEEDIIEQNIKFHYAMGVDGFIVVDHNSTDRTGSILRRLVDEGVVLEVIKKTSIKHEHSVWVDEMIRLAKIKYKADWIINADADEFFYSQDLNIKESLCRYPKVNAFKVESNFVFPDESENFLYNPYFNKNPLKDFELDMLGIRSEYSEYFSLKVARTCPKIIHKTKGYVKIESGNHRVYMKNLCLAPTNDIVLYHYHIASYARYEDKARRWAESAKYLTKGSNYLTHIVDLLNKNKLREYYDCFYNKDMKKFLIDNGVIVRDFSVRNFMKLKGIV